MWSATRRSWAAGVFGLAGCVVAVAAANGEVGQGKKAWRIGGRRKAAMNYFRVAAVAAQPRRRGARATPVAAEHAGALATEAEGACTAGACLPFGGERTGRCLWGEAR